MVGSVAGRSLRKSTVVRLPRPRTTIFSSPPLCCAASASNASVSLNPPYSPGQQNGGGSAAGGIISQDHDITLRSSASAVSKQNLRGESCSFRSEWIRSSGKRLSALFHRLSIFFAD